MPGLNKIALFGMGGMAKVIFAGAAALNFIETKKTESFSVFDNILKLAEPVDNTILVKAYKEVQRKYYPEKDVLKKEISICQELNK